MCLIAGPQSATVSHHMVLQLEGKPSNPLARLAYAFGLGVIAIQSLTFAVICESYLRPLSE